MNRYSPDAVRRDSIAWGRSPGCEISHTGDPFSACRRLQSLLSIYLIAIWVLTYFGRPFRICCVERRAVTG